MLIKISSALLLASLLSSTFSTSVFAAGQEQPLSSGKPAGVKSAQRGPGLTLTVVGLAVVAGGIALVASGSDETKPSVTTTGTFVTP
jgi:hypothetical protein